MVFRDRKDAGRQLASRLEQLGLDRPVVLGMARGGVPVAFEISEALRAPLDVIVVRKLGHPSQPELGMGALAEGGVRVVNAPLVAQLHVPGTLIDKVAAREQTELERRLAAYRGDRPAVDVEGRTVVVVDDGLATGSTALAAVESLRRRGAKRVVLAVPVAPPAAVASLEDAADDVVCCEVTERFFGISEWYHDFRQVPDEEVVRLLVEAHAAAAAVTTELEVPVPGARLPGELVVPAGATGLVVFAHGSGSSRSSPRNRAVASALQAAGLATFLFDLLTEPEASERANVFDVPLLASRLEAATQFVRERDGLAGLPVGLFGASTGAAAALVAAAHLTEQIGAVVSRGGRPDLAGDLLASVTAPTLLVVGGRDLAVLDLNRGAERLLRAPCRIEVVEGATHLFEEPGAIERVAALASAWFTEHLHKSRSL
ncbi:MAG TPA: phosphoribosyltransferase family protein [Acidimicrobiales bacterium]|nr:phosphoribosyltransferase family protein [Acidimicrobiales bacterium]